MKLDSFAPHATPQFPMNYLWDDQFHLFRRANIEDFPYSDGAEVEDRLLSVVSKADDRGTFSPELAASITDWPSEYHLSQARHCLVRPLGIGAGDRVLELGCGCGAVTRYLGEIGANVVAVEGSLGRARVAAERCRELTNVRVVVDDLLRFETAETFDCILLIGVLEYAAVFSTSENPVQHYLQSISRFLGPGGRVVVAIENKLGLKYFNGCGEDHVGAPFFGIQDLYGPRTPRTFGRQELIAQLAAAGLPRTYFYYPYPDYKLPSVILAEDALSDPDFDAVDLIARSHARDYTGAPYRGFDEALAFSTLGENGLLADLSNSFLVVAAADAELARHGAELATAYSSYRAAEFATQTRFVRGDKIRVLKEYLVSLAGDRRVTTGGMTISNRLIESGYQPGRQILWRLLRARARSGDLEPAVEALSPWMGFLLRHTRMPTAEIADFSGRPPSLTSHVLPGDFLDCTPFNLIESGDNLVTIDVEWHSDRDVPLGWVVARGVVHSLGAGVPSSNRLQSVTQVISALCDKFGLSVSSLDIENWLEQEAGFQAVVTGRPYQGIRTTETSGGLRTFVDAIASLNLAVAARDAQITSLNQAVVTSVDAIARLNEEVATRDARITSLNQAVAKRDEQIINLNRALSEVEQQVATLHESVSQFASNQGKLLARLDEMGRQSDCLRDQLKSRTDQLNAIVGSRSWRLTSPLRAIRKHITVPKLRRYRQSVQLSRDRQLIANSSFFDANWYVAQYPDVAQAGADPITHYLQYGGLEGRDPSQAFSSKWYLAQNPDVRAAGRNPLLHYVQFGAAEGRRAKPAENESIQNLANAQQEGMFSPGNIQDAQEEWDRSGHAHLQALLASDDRLCLPLATGPILSIILVLHNKAHLSLLSIESIVANADVSFELIIVDNASTDSTFRLLERIDGARVLRNSTNVGFGPACMQAAAEAHGEFLCFFNNDALLLPNALRTALKNFSGDSSVGVVGGKILLANGALQEAGSIIWSDGSALGYGRGDGPDRPQYSFRRPVDFCSGAFLLTPTRLFHSLGGFSSRFSPAYYEDTDYCLAVWQKGLRVIYEPEAVIRHYESASSGGNELAKAQMAANQAKFVEKWQDVLARHYPPRRENIARARISVASDKLRVLYIDDRIPHKHLGSGLPRSNYIINHLASMGHHVTCATFTFPLAGNEYLDVSRGVELFDGFRHRDQLLKEYLPHCDVVWISRPHNMQSFLASASRILATANCKVVYDAEAIFAEREQLKAKVSGEPSAAQSAADASQELALAAAADIVVVVSEKDRQAMLAAGIRDVYVIGFQISPHPTPATFDERHTFLFIGAMHGEENPNADSMRYFCNSIWPHVRDATSSNLIVVGYGTDIVVGDLNTQSVKVMGTQEDLTPFYNDARVFIAPTRYAAGMPYKAYEAAAHGVPMVVSEVIAHQLKWREEEDYLVAGNSKTFTESCYRLYTNQRLWQTLRSNALVRVSTELGEQIITDTLFRLIHKLSTLDVGRVRSQISR